MDFFYYLASDYTFYSYCYDFPWYVYTKSLHYLTVCILEINA